MRVQLRTYMLIDVWVYSTVNFIPLLVFWELSAHQCKFIAVIKTACKSLVRQVVVLDIWMHFIWSYFFPENKRMSSLLLIKDGKRHLGFKIISKQKLILSLKRWYYLGRYFSLCYFNRWLIHISLITTAYQRLILLSS